MTQKTAGSKVGLKQSTVSTIEADAARTSVESLYKLLSALGLELLIRDKQSDRTASSAKTREW
jgi:HTH-type transcriptional regulator/antitoxin HipB